MQFAQVGRNSISHCGHCDELFVVKGADSFIDAIEQLKTMAEAHRSQSPACQKWYSELPSLSEVMDSLRSCAKESNESLSDENTDNLNSEETQRMAEITDFQNLITRLRAYSPGQTVWRVADKDTHAHCIEFTRQDSVSPEFECRRWHKESSKRCPEQYANYIVESKLVYSQNERLCLEAADAIEKLLEASATAN